MQSPVVAVFEKAPVPVPTGSGGKACVNSSVGELTTAEHLQVKHRCFRSASMLSVVCATMA